MAWIFRLIFVAILFFVAVLLITKSKVINRKRMINISVIVSVVVFGILDIFPVENLFITFSTPESAFKYMSSDSIKLIVNGESTSLIISVDRLSSDEVSTIIPRNDDGWKLRTGISQETNILGSVGHFAVMTENTKNSSDYYVTVFDSSDGAEKSILDISDNKGSSFQHYIQYDNARGVAYVAYVKDYGEDFELYINGELVELVSF